MLAALKNGGGKLALWVMMDALYILVVVSLVSGARQALGMFLIAHVFGIAIATMVMFTGIGAGVLWVPFFTLIGCSPTEGVSLSLFTQIAGKGSGSFQYLRDKLIDWQVVKVFAPYALCGVTMGYLAGFSMPEEHENWLLFIFAMVVVYLIVTMVRSLKDGSSQEAGPVHEGRLKKSGLVVQVSSFFTGLLSIGNSDWLIPYMERRLKMPDCRAVATGIFIMFIVSVFFLLLTAGSVALGIRGWPHFLPLLLATCSGVFMGAQIGSRLIRIACFRKHQRHAFIVMLILSAAHMFYTFLSNL